MHMRFVRASVDGSSASEKVEPSTAGESAATRGLRVVWAHRRLNLDAQGSRAAVAVALDAGRLLVRVVDGAAGSSAWMPTQDLLSDAQVRRWIGGGGFER